MAWEFVEAVDLVKTPDRNEWTARAVFRETVTLEQRCESYIWYRVAQPTVAMRNAARDLILARLNEPPGPPVTLRDIIDDLEELGQRALARGKTVQQIKNAAKRRLEDLIEELV